jgi:S-DNA-T family DNA segregation ATPase FtsK/SpoIIIE
VPDKEDVVPAIHGKTEILQEAIKADHLVPPVSFLTDTSIDHYFDNKNDGENYEAKITKFLARNDFVATYQKTIVMPLFIEISYDVESQTTIDNILKSQNDLLGDLKLDTFNISFKGNTVRFEIPNDKPSKISIKSILMAHPEISSEIAIVGMGYENNPLTLDIDKHPRSLIIGKRGSGGAMLLSVIITSLAYINQPKLMEIIILSPVGDKSLKYFDHLPHMKYPVISDLTDTVNKLHDLRNEIAERESKFAELGATNIKEANRYIGNTNTPYKEILLVISAFDKIIKNSLQNMELIGDLLKRGPAAGVRFILLATNVNNESIEPTIYNQFDIKFILKLESEQESLRMFDNYRGVQLQGNGDGYYIDTKADKRIRFQTCYLNVDELIQIIKIIKTFHEAKISG